MCVSVFLCVLFLESALGIRIYVSDLSVFWYQRFTTSSETWKLGFHLHPSLSPLLNIIVMSVRWRYRFCFLRQILFVSRKEESLLCVVTYLLYLLFFPDVIFSFVWRIFLSHSLRRGPQISKYFSLVFFFKLNFFLTVSHGMYDLSSPTRNWARTTCRGNIEVLSLKYSAAREVCIFIMSYTQFGCFQPRFLKIALSAPFPFFSSCGIPVVQMLDQLLLSQRFLRLLIFFVCLFVCLFSLVFRLGKFYCYILKFTDSICHFYYWICAVNSYLLLYFLFFLPFLTACLPPFLLSFLCLLTLFLAEICCFKRTCSCLLYHGCFKILVR